MGFLSLVVSIWLGIILLRGGVEHELRSARVLLVLLPIHRVGLDVSAHAVPIVLIAEDVFVVVALPDGTKPTGTRPTARVTAAL